MIEAVRGAKCLRAAQSERAREVDHVDAGGEQRRGELERRVYGRAEQRHGAFARQLSRPVRRGISQLSRRASRTEALLHVVALPAVAAHHAQLRVRVVRQDAGRLDAGIAGSAQDGQGNFLHGVA